MQPKQKAPSDSSQPWFKIIPVGVNPLRGMMTRISQLAGLPVKYTNHSLRATSASRMFASGVPEKIVAEMTGHKSVKALRQYERTTEEQFQAVGHFISHMQTFDPQSTIETVSTSQVKEETLLKTECGVIQVKEEEKVITKTDSSRPLQGEGCCTGGGDAESFAEHLWQFKSLHVQFLVVTLSKATFSCFLIFLLCSY